MSTFNIARVFTQRIAVAWLHFCLLAALLAGAVPARAEAPQATTQVPGYYHMTLGKFQVTALYDGPIALHTKLLKNVPAQDVQRLLAHLFHSRRRFRAERMNTAMHRRIAVTVKLCFGINHRFRFLRAGGAIEISQRLAINLTIEQREIRTHPFH